MTRIVRHIRWIMIVSGTLTATMIYAEGDRYLIQQAGVAVAIDGVMVFLFAWYLLAALRPARAAIGDTR